MNVVCSKCNYSWNYKGKSAFYATCPMCLKKVKISKKEVDKNG